MLALEVFLLISVWGIVAAGLAPFVVDGQMEAHNVVFWPIALLKWLLHQLYLVLFTGWE